MVEYLLADSKLSAWRSGSAPPSTNPWREIGCRRSRSVVAERTTPKYRSWRAYSIPGWNCPPYWMFCPGRWCLAPRVVVLGSDQAALVTADFLAQGPSGSGGCGRSSTFAPELAAQ